MKPAPHPQPFGADPFDFHKPPTAEDLLEIHLKELGCEYAAQYLYARPRRLRADFAIWKDRYRFGPRRLIVEVQGGVWIKKAEGMHDIDRAQQACLNDWYWMPVTVKQVESGEAKEMVKRWLEG